MSPRQARRKLPMVLLPLLLAICVPSMLFAPAGVKSWALEVVPGLLLVAFLAASYRRFPLSNWVYVGTFLHILVLIYVSEQQPALFHSTKPRRAVSVAPALCRLWVDGAALTELNWQEG